MKTFVIFFKGKLCDYYLINKFVELFNYCKNKQNI